MTKTQKFLEFLRYITRHSKFCIKKVAQDLEVSTKTIQRYKKELQEFLGIEFKEKEKGCYLTLNLKKIKEILLDPKDMEAATRLAEILVLLENSNFDSIGLDKEIIETFKNDIYHLKEYPFEDLRNRHIKKIKECIKWHKYANIVYEADQHYVFKYAKPLKLVFAEGNWYLATLTNDEINHGFKFLRINFIKEFTPLPKTFHKDYDALRFIKEFRTLFSSYKEPDFVVRAIVSPQIARHFKVKRFIPTQQIQKEHDDGSLEMTFVINNDREILHLAKRWLPEMRIIEPVRLQKELEKMCRKFLGEKI